MSSSDSSPSPSPPSSPEASFHGPPDLERLVLHFVSAKRALTSTQYVHRANEIITGSRALIEEIATLNAKNGFARRGVDEQIETLEAIHNGINDAGEKVDFEFQQTIARLDVANDRLQTTLAGLRKVLIDPSLGQPARPTTETSAQGELSTNLDDSEATKSRQRTLHDFVDEANHEEVLASLRGFIDSYRDSQSDLDDNVARLSESITHITEILLDLNKDSDPPKRPTPYDEPPLLISTMWHDMEAHAADMAGSLQSLISHYDLSVSALKHTEGGGEAAKLALPAGVDIDDSLYAKKVPDPIDDAERAEMLRVLENDAVEVDDVAAEIKDRADDMESLFTQLSDRADAARRSQTQLVQAYKSLLTIKTSLPLYIEALDLFRTSWSSIQVSIIAKTEELVGFCGFYEQFQTSYKKLLREADRRKAAAEQMRTLASKARRDLDRLWRTDQKARDTFMEDVGVFLPGDLAPGLAGAATRWEVMEVSTEESVERHEDGSRDGD
ncbi:Autophagy-related protein 17 [Oleoguttula sp. CCFEE 5521]